MSEGRILFEKQGNVAHVRFDNPAAYNALTHRMWMDLRDTCRTIAGDHDIRVVTFRGMGGKAFISGTDIGDFVDFATGGQGVAYERGIDEYMAAVDAIPVTTIAVVEGFAVGGGINISSACDFRIATPGAKFGSPIGRTIGNCLSASSLARISSAVGLQIARRMVLLGELIEASEMLGQAASVLEQHPAALQLRTLATLAEISVERNSTIVFPLPFEIMRVFEGMARRLESDRPL